MYPDVQTIKALLLQQSYISEADSSAAEQASHDSAGYIDFLMRGQLLSKTLLGQALAEHFTMPFADLTVNRITKESIERIPEDVARNQRVVFVKESDTVVAIATDTPLAVKAKEISQFFPKKKIRLAYTLPEYIDTSFRLYAKPLSTRFSQIFTTSKRVAPEIVDEIINEALTFKASDIHFDPQLDGVEVRFRVDGTLREAGVLPREYYENILNRIKVESGMRIDEHMSAQDGTLQRISGSITTDLRVSLIPTVNGEKVVMRLLGSYVQSYDLADIGLDDAHRELIETYAAKPFGMILTVGPTGSGKTTTLYALLKLLNTANVNVTTIEDPVEYKMAGVNQIQINESANMTFAKGLRSIVRQDPDIILVGEIRDKETAEISVNAALTGHLLLSTFHSNNAATAIPRLVDMGIEPFLLASTLQVVIAQRLVRKICMSCRHTIPISKAVEGLKVNPKLVQHYFPAKTSVYSGKGCAVCNNTGFSGRLALFQFIEITPEMQELILKSPSTNEIEALARKQGSVSMFEDGIAKIKGGMTTVGEVLRVVEPPTKKP